jgi:hypothetical protein
VRKEAEHRVAVARLVPAWPLVRRREQARRSSAKLKQSTGDVTLTSVYVKVGCGVFTEKASSLAVIGTSSGVVRCTLAVVGGWYTYVTLTVTVAAATDSSPAVASSRTRNVNPVKGEPNSLAGGV